MMTELGMNGASGIYAFAKEGKCDMIREVISSGMDVDKPDLEGRTLAYHAAAHMTLASGAKNPVLGLLIFKNNALFISKKSGLLSAKEKRVRSFVFFLTGGALALVSYLYLFVSNNATYSCQRAFGGLLLQPYLFSFVSVFVLKFFQYLVEEIFAPAADFLWFVLRKSNHDSDTEAKSHTQNVARPTLATTVNPLTGDAKVVDPIPRFKQAFDEDKGVEIVTTTHFRHSLPDLEMNNTASHEPTEGFVKVEHSRPPSSWSSILLNFVFHENTVKWWRQVKYQSAYKIDADYYGEDFWLQTPFLFYYMQIISAIISIIVAFVHIDTSLSLWNQYENLYAVIVNSGVPTACYSHIKMMFLDKREPQMYGGKSRDNHFFPGFPAAVQFLTTLPFLFMVPVVFSHVIPAFIMYGYMTLLIGIPFCCGMCGLLGCFRVRGENNPLAIYFMMLFAEIMGRFLFVLVFQVFFGYSAYAFSVSKTSKIGDTNIMSPTAYIDAIIFDYTLRSQTICFIKNTALSAQGWVLLFSWF